MEIGEKIKAYRLNRGESLTEFANNANVSRDRLAKWEQLKSKPNYNDLAAISNYLEVSMETLTGKYFPEHLNLSKEAQASYSVPTIMPSGDILKVGGGKFPRKKPDGRILIPFYDIDFTAGDIELFDDFNELAPTYMLDIPEFYGCTAFRVFNNSMEKLIKSGATLFGTKVNEWQDHLEYGPMYGIVCTDKRKYLKYIRKAQGKEETHFLLRSENIEEYDDFYIPKSKIKSLWLIHGALNRYF